MDGVLLYKDYKRIFTSGFLHVSWMHLIFNMISLYIFSGVIERSLGGINFLIIYFTSLLGGELLSLFVHRNHPDYSSVGASGAVCGIIFASIALFPGMSVGLFLLPIAGWLYGILFVGFSIYAIRSNKNNIGHEAHLGGALAGMIVAVLIQPTALAYNYMTILVIAVPTIAFIYIILTRPHVLLIDNFYFNRHKNHYSPDHKYNEEKTNSQQEIDKILDKINTKGIKSLSKKEKDKLRQYSQKIR